MKIIFQIKKKCLIDLEKNEDEENGNKPIQSIEAIKKLAQTESKTQTQLKFFKGIYITMEIVFITLLLVHGVGMTGMALDSVLFSSSKPLHYDRQVRVDRNDTTFNNIICDTVLAMGLKNNEQDQNKTDNCFTKISVPFDFFSYSLVFAANLAMIFAAAIRLNALIEQNKEESYSKIDDHGKGSSGQHFRRWFVIGFTVLVIELFVVYISMQLEREEGMEMHIGDFVFINDKLGVYFWLIVANLFFINEALSKFVEVRCNNLSGA